MFLNEVYDLLEFIVSHFQHSGLAFQSPEHHS